MSENKQPTSHSPAVSRAALILDILAAHGAPLGVSEIARRLEAPRSTAANILGALEQSELVVRVDNTFRLGPLLTHLARAYLSQVELIPKFYAACSDLRFGSEETVLLAELDRAHIVYLARHEGAQLFRIVGTVGGRSPAGGSALGLAMLADVPDTELDQLLSGSDETPGQLEAGLESRELIEATRARGFAIDDEVSTPGLVSVAKSLPERDGRRFAVGITLLKAGVDDDKVEAVAKELTELIEAVSP